MLEYLLQRKHRCPGVSDTPQKALTPQNQDGIKNDRPHSHNIIWFSQIILHDNLLSHRFKT